MSALMCVHKCVYIIIWNTLLGNRTFALILYQIVCSAVLIDCDNNVYSFETTYCNTICTLTKQNMLLTRIYQCSNCIELSYKCVCLSVFLYTVRSPYNGCVCQQCSDGK